MSDDGQKFPSELAERFQVRMPEGLRDRIARAAQENNRSMNAEIVLTLLEAYPPPPSVFDVVWRARELLEKIRGQKSLQAVADLQNLLVDIEYELVRFDEQQHPDEDREP